MARPWVVAPVDPPLTPVQVRILGMLEQGMTYAEIAAEVGYSPPSMKKAVRRIRAVMGVPTSVAAVAHYVRHDEAKRGGWRRRRETA